jgi:hypothetical protein
MEQDSVFRRIALGHWALPLIFLLGVPGCRAQTATGTPYQEVFYSNGKLRLQGYLYKPQGSGPFPVVIYNHAGRPGSERTPTPYVYVGALLRDSGYLVLVAEGGVSVAPKGRFSVNSATRIHWMRLVACRTKPATCCRHWIF